MNSNRHAAASDPWASLVMFLLLGYMCMQRAFSYVGIPPLHIFLGEVVLAWFLLFGPRLGAWRWFWVAQKLPRLRRFNRALYLLLAYGAFQIVHGISAGYSPLTAVRDFAFDYYPLYFFLGLWVGLREPGHLPRFVRIFAWINGIYGTAYVLFLNRLTWTMPGVSQQVAPVSVFGLPEYSCVALLGLLAFEESLRDVWLLLVLNGFVMLGMQVRGEWLGFAVGLAIFAWRSWEFKRATWGAALLVLMLGIMSAGGFRLAALATRGGGAFSAQDLIGRAVAPVSTSLAANYTANYQTATDTTVWRLVWWAAIWGAVHESASRAVLGFGYGYPIGDLVPYLKGNFIQTPHSVFFYALGYTGWLGVIIFFWFLAGIGRLLWMLPDPEVRHFAVAAFAALVIYAVFEPYFEAPYGAIPFYLVFGFAAASLLSRQSLPATGRQGAAVSRGPEPENVPAVAT